MGGCICGEPFWSIIRPRCPVHDPDVESAVRDAIERYLASRRADPEFRRRLAYRIERDRPILDRLAVDDR